MNTNLTRNWLEKLADACGKQGAETAADAAPAAPIAFTKPGDIMSDEQRIFGSRVRASLMGEVHTAGIKLPDER